MRTFQLYERGKSAVENPGGVHTRLVLGFLAALIVLRAAVAAYAPLAFDEAYYWLWSKHLAAGYLDHPPLIAFAIRLGTAVFGDTQFGVRAVPLVLLIAASWAVWRSGASLLQSKSGGALAALLFNLTLMVNIEGLVATPDAPAMAEAAFFVFFLVKVAETEQGVWWLAVGAAGGFALISKYTAPFLGAGALLWLLVSRKERHWLGSVWPYLGAALALAMFAPVVMWNAEHGWISFAMQFGRVGSGGFTLRYLGEFLAGQLGLATPFVAVLGAVGLLRIVHPRATPTPLVLIAAIIAPAALYFLWHSLHDRVQGNWPSFLYPAFSIAAAATWNARGQGAGARMVRWSQYAAVPVASVLTLVVYVHVFWPLVPLQGLRDPIARLLAVGYQPVADKIDDLRQQAGARAIITTSYAQTGWLVFYLPSHPPVVQLNERERWLNEPPPAADMFVGPLLYVTEDWRDEKELIAARFGQVTQLARIPRLRSGQVIEEYVVYRVSGPKAAVLN